MKDPFLVDSRCLAPSETYDAAQGLNWLHDGHTPNGNGDYLILFITLWHVCSLLQPDFLFKSQHISTATSVTDPTCCHPTSGELNLPGPRRAPPLDLVRVQLFDVDVPPLERLAAAWPSHSIHVSTLAPHDDQFEAHILDWLCDNTRRVGPVEDLEAARTRARVLDAEGGGERMFAWAVDVSLGAGWNVGCENRSESPLVTAWIQMDYAAMTRSACLEGSWHGHGHGHGHCPGVVSNFKDSPDPLGQARAHNGRTWIQPSSVAQAQDPHEAHGVGIIVKAMVQQNAGASLFLRMMVACIAVLLCLAHSIKDRPSSAGRRKS